MTKLCTVTAILPGTDLSTDSSCRKAIWRKARFFERAERFPLDSFLLSINGRQLPRFSLLSQGEAPDKTTLFSNRPVKAISTFRRCNPAYSGLTAGKTAAPAGRVRASG